MNSATTRADVAGGSWELQRRWHAGTTAKHVENYTRAAIRSVRRVQPSLMEQAMALRPRLMAYAYRLTSNKWDAEDLVQSTLLRAWRAEASFQAKHDGSLTAWLKRILYNLHVHPFSHPRSVRANHLPQMFAHEPYPCGGEDLVALSQIECAMQKLAPERRKCFLMARAGYEYAEIAEACGCRVGTVKSRVNRVAAELGRLMEAM